MTATVFHSPWQRSGYVALVAGIRRVLRPFGDLEHRYIASLVSANNRRVARHLEDFPARKVLLIMPRCVKKTGCGLACRLSPAQIWMRRRREISPLKLAPRLANSANT
jgi:hypothetical protein